MFNSLILFISGAVIMAGLDFVWIGTLFAKLYKHELAAIGRIVAGEFKPHPAGIIVYFLMSLGVMAFVLPKVDAGNLWQALAFGALFGLIIGGVYDLTNYSILTKWSLNVVVVDMLWIMISGALSTLAMVAIRDFLL